MGINIPILPEIHLYILKDLKFFGAKSIVLMNNSSKVGHVLLFDDGKETLYFGYFGVDDQSINKISCLIDEIISYAKLNELKVIRGPINIPTIIYGWGFMKEGSKTDVFIMKPVNPPIYQEIFLRKNFFIKYEEVSWDGIMPRINPWKLKQYDFSDYEYFNPENLEELMKFKSDFLKLHADNMPPSSRLTPNVVDLFDNYADFIFKFGGNYMFYFIRYKPTGKIIACGSIIPNIFKKGSKGNYDSCIFYTGVVDSNFRRKGLFMLMYGETSRQAWKKGYRFASGPIAADNKASIGLAHRVGAEINRTHLILEYNIKSNNAI